MRSPAPLAGARLDRRSSGWLRHYRGVNETISSLLLAYIAIALINHLVEGAAARPGQPQQAVDHGRSATPTCVGSIPGTDVHWGLVVGIVACVGALAS